MLGSGAVKARLALITIGQAPRIDVVPEMAEILGPGVELVERGALDDLGPAQIAALAPGPGDDVLVTRLADGSSVFVAKRHITPLAQQRIREVEALGVGMTVLMCTGRFEGLQATRPLAEPDKILLGVLRGVRFPGRLGVLTPSPRHVEQAERHWREYGFDPVVVPLSPYEAGGELATVADQFRAGGTGFLLLDCIGFRQSLRRDLQAAVGVPVVVANLLVARVVAEMLGL
jgi:protein AroM